MHDIPEEEGDDDEGPVDDGSDDDGGKPDQEGITDPDTHDPVASDLFLAYYVG